eukprot:7837942-Karenia_brevis.AAC.1
MKGPSVVCDLSINAVHDAIKCHTTSAHDNDTYISKMVSRTAERAVKLTNIVKYTVDMKKLPSLNITQHHCQVPSVEKKMQSGRTYRSSTPM